MSVMHIDATDLRPPATLKYQVCIIGAGAAGITLAKEFHNSGITVGLIESGGLEPDATQLLAEGETSEETIPNRLRYLGTSRTRYFGGTTNVWTGWCRPLDRLDYEKREWVPYSGWPISRSEVEPFYERATSYCQIPSFDYSTDQRELEERINIFTQPTQLRSRLFHMGPPTRFGMRYREEILESRNVTVLLHANVTR